MEAIENCHKCPRLRSYCHSVATQAKRKSYREQTYWGKPVADFGSQPASLLVVGLAPGAHGANRTGRLITGDRSGDWLYRALYRFGFSNQSTSEHRDDGLQLIDCVVTNVVHCAPPNNKPNPEEIRNCSSFLTDCIQSTQPRVFVCLGAVAWTEILRYFGARNRLIGTVSSYKFGHGKVVQIVSGETLIASFHPSQQNTFTKKLTEPMFDHIFQTARNLCET